MTSRPLLLIRRRLGLGALATAVTLLAVTVVAPTAQADPGGPDALASAIVSRLSVTDGRGWVTVQPRIGQGQVVGFEVVIPAGGGSWGGAADIAVPELGIHCRVGTGPDLHYTCGSWLGGSGQGGPTLLPRGGYQVTLPVTRVGGLGSLTGLAGHSWIVALDGYGTPAHYGADSFPVLDGAHYRSTAELRSAPLSLVPGTTDRPDAILPVTMTVVPGEVITALDIPLPGVLWWVNGTNAGSYGMRCEIRPVGLGESLHCAGKSGPLPAGRYQLVTSLRSNGPVDDYPLGTASLTAAGSAPEPVDSFEWAFPPAY